VTEPGRSTAPALTLERLWGILVVAGPVIGALAVALPTIDLAYHVRAGEEMLRSGALPRSDTYTFTVPGAAWLDQQWGAQLLTALAYRAWGWSGVSLLRAALVGVTYACVFLACRRAGAAARAAAVLTALSFVIGLYHLPMRPQLFGIGSFAIALWVVEGRRDRPVRLWLLPLLAALGANLHGSFVLVPLLGGLAWLEDTRKRHPVARTDLAATAASLVATLANPFGPRVWSYAVDIATSAEIRDLITEWQPPTVRTYSGLAFYASVALAIGFLARRGGPAPWFALARLGVFFALAVPAVRGIVWWALAGPVVVAGLLGPARPRDDRGSPRINAVLAAAMAAGVLVAIPRGDRALAGPILRGAPVGLTREAAGILEPGTRLFVAQAWGSWFELAVPAVPVFVDSRIEIYPRRVLDDYLAIASGREGWQGLLDRYGVEAAVLNEDQTSGLIARMGADPGWTLVYQDEDGFLFVRG
jgi:hypothetical protein